MAVTYAVLTGRITHPGSDTALPGLVTAVPLAKFAGVVIPGERLTQGVVSAPVDAAGNLPAAGLKVPVVAGSPMLWRLVFEPSSTTARPDTNGGALPPWPFYVGTITASTTVMALATTEPTALLADFPPSLVSQVLTARDQTVAVGNTNDTIIASRINDPASATRAAGNGVYGRRVDRPVSAKAHGVIADGVVDDGASLAAAITAAGTGGTVLLPPGNLRIIAPVQIAGSITLQGGGAYGTRIFADGCNGIEVAAGVVDFRMLGVEVASKVRHSTTANTLIGIKVSGTNASRPSGHVYRDVYIDGFRTAFQSAYLWSSVFDNFRSDFGLLGIDAYGLSVNNFVTNSNVAVQQVAGSVGIRLFGQVSATDAAKVASEGWTIANSVIFGGEIGVHLLGVTHCNISDNIIDFCAAIGVYIQDNGANFGGNTKVAGNYIAMSGTAGNAAVTLGNTISNVQNVGNRITDNHAVVYAGSVCAHGIFVTDTRAFSTISGNVIRGFATTGNAINLATTTGSTVIGNRCIDIPGAGGNIYAEGINHIEGNDGIVYLLGGNPNVYSVDALGKKTWLGLQFHTVGLHEWGDRVLNARPAAGGTPGWVCTTGGGASSATWAASTAYAAGVWIKTSTGKVLECTVAGTSSATEPNPTVIGSSFTDGTVTWVYRSATAAVFKAMGVLAA